VSNIRKMIPRGGLGAKEWCQDFIDTWGNQIDAVIVIARHKDGTIIDGWSKEIQKDVIFGLGMIEQLKLDFWYTLFEKRVDIIK